MITQEKYPMPYWATKQVIRASGLIEDICEHGMGHPNKAFLKANPNYIGAHSSHTCDGCCNRLNDDKEKKEHAKKKQKENEKRLEMSDDGEDNKSNSSVNRH